MTDFANASAVVQAYRATREGLPRLMWVLHNAAKQAMVCIAICSTCLTGDAITDLITEAENLELPDTGEAAGQEYQVDGQLHDATDLMALTCSVCGYTPSPASRMKVTFGCATCGASMSGTKDERDAAHLEVDGAHPANWYRGVDEVFECDIVTATDRGINHGWSAANYARAYGTQEARDEQAERRAIEQVDAVRNRTTSDYRAGFIIGWDRFANGHDADGDPIH